MSSLSCSKLHLFFSPLLVRTPPPAYFTAGWLCCWPRLEAIHVLKTSLKGNTINRWVQSMVQLRTCIARDKNSWTHLQWPTTHSLEQYSSSHSVLVMAGLVQPCRMQWFPVTPPSTPRPPAPGPFTSSPLEAFKLMFPCCCCCCCCCCCMEEDGVIWNSRKKRKTRSGRST